MRESRDIMGMPVTVEIVQGSKKDVYSIFDYFSSIDDRFSTYKDGSEISKINRGEIDKTHYSEVMKEIFTLSQKTYDETNGFFSIKRPDGTIDPSGIVKGWAIYNAAHIADKAGHHNYFIDVGGDIQSKGVDESGASWTIGIRNPFNLSQIIKVIRPEGLGVATSGTYIRGQHIYNPHNPSTTINDIVSLTVIGPNVYEADRFATAAFAMGSAGIRFIESLSGFEGYVIDPKGIATMTNGFEHFVV